MVEPGERSNFASSALFLSISLVLYVVLRALPERRNSKSQPTQMGFLPLKVETQNRSWTYPLWFPKGQQKQYALINLFFKARD